MLIVTCGAFSLWHLCCYQTLCKSYSPFLWAARESYRSFWINQGFKLSHMATCSRESQCKWVHVPKKTDRNPKQKRSYVRMQRQAHISGRNLNEIQKLDTKPASSVEATTKPDAVSLPLLFCVSSWKFTISLPSPGRKRETPANSPRLQRRANRQRAAGVNRRSENGRDTRTVASLRALAFFSVCIGRFIDVW